MWADFFLYQADNLRKVFKGPVNFGRTVSIFVFNVVNFIPFYSVTSRPQIRSKNWINNLFKLNKITFFCVSWKILECTSLTVGRHLSTKKVVWMFLWFMGRSGFILKFLKAAAVAQILLLSYKHRAYIPAHNFCRILLKQRQDCKPHVSRLIYVDGKLILTASFRGKYFFRCH